MRARKRERHDGAGGSGGSGDDAAGGHGGGPSGQGGGRGKAPGRSRNKRQGGNRQGGRRGSGPRGGRGHDGARSAGSDHDLWGDVAKLPEPRSDVRITDAPAAVPRSLGKPPLPGHETVAEHYFGVVYERAVMTAGALAAASGLIDAGDLVEDEDG